MTFPRKHCVYYFYAAQLTMQSNNTVPKSALPKLTINHSISLELVSFSWRNLFSNYVTFSPSSITCIMFRNGNLWLMHERNAAPDETLYSSLSIRHELLLSVKRQVTRGGNFICNIKHFLGQTATCFVHSYNNHVGRLLFHFQQLFFLFVSNESMQKIEFRHGYTVC